ncbi:unnamed protein product [Boreogadus saida]
MAPTPSNRCPPITLIGEREVVLSVARRWVAAVYAVHHLTSAPPGPRMPGVEVASHTCSGAVFPGLVWRCPPLVWSCLPRPGVELSSQAWCGGVVPLEVSSPVEVSSPGGEVSSHARCRGVPHHAGLHSAGLQTAAGGPIGSLL